MLKKNLFVVLILLFSFFLNGNIALSQCSIEQIITASQLSQDTIISISVRDFKTGQEVYSKNSTLPLKPASTLKAITTPVILNTLGKRYKLKTSLYTDSKNLYLKLGADPNLTSSQLTKALKKVKNKNYENIFIDDTISNDTNWGMGWLADNNTNPLMPRYSTYNIDRNSVTLDIAPDGIKINPYYPMFIANSLTQGASNSINTRKDEKENLFISGTINSHTYKTMPIDNPEKFFIYRLKEALANNNINYCEIKKASIPLEIKKIAVINHKLSDVVKQINKNSDNFAIESVFLIAGEGKTQKGINKVYTFYKQKGLDTSSIKIVDASGVSHSNRINTGWMSQALFDLKNQPDFRFYFKTLPFPGAEGTLHNRLQPIRKNLHAKTGTLNGVSALAGYLKASSGKKYTFAIFIQDFQGSSKPAKQLEDKIIMDFYNNL